MQYSNTHNMVIDRMSSIFKVTNRMGVLAERLDEIGANVLNNVDKIEKPVVAPQHPILDTPRAIIHANGDVTELMSVNSLPVELIHRIFLHLKPSIEELTAVSSVNKCVLFPYFRKFEGLSI